MANKKDSKAKKKKKDTHIVDAYHENDPRLRGEKEKKLPNQKP